MNLHAHPIVTRHRTRAREIRIAQDRGKISPRSALKRAKKLERLYAGRLRGIARIIGTIVAGYDLTDPVVVAPLIRAHLERYAQILQPWAEAAGKRMIAEVAAADRGGWKKFAATVGREVDREIQSAPTGIATQESLQRQVNLITSLPREAAERVHELTVKGISEGKRYPEIAAEIMKTGHVTASRATLIARTEVSRTATEFTRARAEHIGSQEFIWRTSKDSDVRPSHKKLDGKVFRWDDPPECDPGHHALPGGIWNCRCYAEPVLID